MDYRKLITDCGQPEYDRTFWNLMRGDKTAEQNLTAGRIVDTGAYALPNSAGGSYEKAVTRESVMRQIGTVLCHYSGSVGVWAALSDDVAEFVPDETIRCGMTAVLTVGEDDEPEEKAEEPTEEAAEESSESSSI